MKDKRWLKEKVRETGRQVDYEFLYIDIQTALELIDQLDEPEVLLHEWIDKYIDYADVGGDTSVYTCRRLTKPTRAKQECPVIPKYVANFIEETKRQYKTLVFAITHIYDKNEIYESPNKEEKRIFQWLELDDNEEVFARAWLDGYEVEKEQLYYVVKDGVVILSKRYGDYESHKSHRIGTVTNKEYIKENPDKLRFTEQEIKDFDERFWSFAVPVEEVPND